MRYGATHDDARVLLFDIYGRMLGSFPLNISTITDLMDGKKPLFIPEDEALGAIAGARIDWSAIASVELDREANVCRIGLIDEDQTEAGPDGELRAIQPAAAPAVATELGLSGRLGGSILDAGAAEQDLMDERIGRPPAAAVRSVMRAIGEMEPVGEMSRFIWDEEAGRFAKRLPPAVDQIAAEIMPNLTEEKAIELRLLARCVVKTIELMSKHTQSIIRQIKTGDEFTAAEICRIFGIPVEALDPAYTPAELDKLAAGLQADDEPAPEPVKEPALITAKQFSEILESRGLIPKNCRKVVIESTAGEAVQIYYDCYGDERLLSVARGLPAVQVKTGAGGSGDRPNRNLVGNLAGSADWYHVESSMGGRKIIVRKCDLAGRKPLAGPFETRQQAKDALEF